MSRPSTQNSRARKRPAAARTIAALRRRGLFVAAVESCTGGALSSALTDVEGASEAFTNGFVVYHDRAKIRLGVSATGLKRHTPYSAWTAHALARAGLKQAVRADLAIGITGTFSRPDPAHPRTPTGYIWIAVVSREDGRKWQRELRLRSTSDRVGAKAKVVASTLALLAQALGDLKN